MASTTDAHTAAQGEMDLLRFATAGSVDDGKSTLIGRLLLDSKSIFEDQLEAVESTAATTAEIIDEIAIAKVTERGATRGDDRFSEAAMEDRKKEGYF